MDKLDEFLDSLQEKIFDDARRAFGEKGFERWRNPRYMGRMQNCDAYARIRGKCGDTMEIYLKFEDGRVRDASYFTDGCASSGLCGSFAAELAMGKDPDELIEITGKAVLEAIGRLPEEDSHCADLAAETLQEALTNYMARTKT